MRIIAMSQQECRELLKRVSIGRLGCSLDDQRWTLRERRSSTKFGLGAPSKEKRAGVFRTQSNPKVAHRFQEFAARLLVANSGNPGSNGARD
jgi:hypothetical protein